MADADGGKAQQLRAQMMQNISLHRTAFGVR